MHFSGDIGGSISPATSSLSSSPPTDHHDPNCDLAAIHGVNANDSGTQAWWEAISHARSCIQALAGAIPTAGAELEVIADSERPAFSLLESHTLRRAVAAAISSSTSGGAEDPLCQWLYDTFQSPDNDLRRVAISFLPLLSGTYLFRVFLSGGLAPLAGFEAVLLAVYSAEYRAREGGRAIVVSIPDLSPRNPNLISNLKSKTAAPTHTPKPHQPSFGILSPPLDPQTSVQSTRRASIVAVALEVFYQQIAQMPSWSKVDICDLISSWAGQNCPCRYELDEDHLTSSSSSASFMSCNVLDEIDDSLGNVNEEIARLTLDEWDNGGTHGDLQRGPRIPLTWELFRPALRILGHCLLASPNPPEVGEAASSAVRSVYARASHELNAQAILASRSLIQLEKSFRAAARASSDLGAAQTRRRRTTTTATTTSKLNTPSKCANSNSLLFLHN